VDRRHAPGTTDCSCGRTAMPFSRNIHVLPLALVTRQHCYARRTFQHQLCQARQLLERKHQQAMVSQPKLSDRSETACPGGACMYMSLARARSLC
jgi:hypothetical protein